MFYLACLEIPFKYLTHKEILKEEEELLAVWLYDVQLYVGLVLTVSII